MCPASIKYSKSISERFNIKENEVLEHLGLHLFDWEAADDDAFEQAYEKVEDSMMGEGREGDALNDYGEICCDILTALADL